MPLPSGHPPCPKQGFPCPDWLAGCPPPPLKQQRLFCRNWLCCCSSACPTAVLPACSPSHLQDRREDAGYAKERASGAAENVKDAVKVGGWVGGVDAAGWVDGRRWYCWVPLALLGAWVGATATFAWLLYCCTASRHTQFVSHPIKPFPTFSTAQRRPPPRTRLFHPPPPLPAPPAALQDGYEGAKGSVGNAVDTVKEAASDLGNTISVGGWVGAGGRVPVGG